MCPSHSMCAVLLAVAASTALAQQATDQNRKPTREQIAGWIAELANRDARPFEKSYVLRPPRNVDRESLRIVKNAYDNLSANIVDAFPSLIHSLNDQRYSYFQESPSGAFICHSVGDACHEIIIAHIEIYREVATVLDRTERPRTVHFISAMGGPEKWLASRKKLSLYELQLEALEWAMKQPRPDPQGLIDDKDWQAAIRKLQLLHTSFTNSKTAVTLDHKLRFEGK